MPGSPFRHALESGRHAANAALKAVDAPVQIGLEQSPEAAAAEAAEAARPHISTWSGTTLVPNADIEAYVDCILSHSHDVVNSPWIPDIVERRVYMLVVKMVLQLVHFACGAIDERRLFGQVVRVAQSHGTQAQLQRADVTLSPVMIDAIIEQVMQDSDHSAIISKSVDQLLYQNAIRFAVRLVVDMASSLRVSTFGLTFKVAVDLDHSNLLKETQRSPMDDAALERLCEPMIRELLADDDVNISMLPDHLEEQLYKNVMRLLANVAAAAADSSEIDLFGIRIEPDIC